jgi:hypothetical protein
VVGSVHVAGALVNLRPIDFDSALRHDDTFLPKQTRSARSVRCLCSSCRRVYVVQKDGERATCIWCKYDPNPKENL